MGFDDSSSDPPTGRQRDSVGYQMKDLERFYVTNGSFPDRICELAD